MKSIDDLHYPVSQFSAKLATAVIDIFFQYDPDFFATLESEHCTNAMQAEIEHVAARFIKDNGL